MAAACSVRDFQRTVLTYLDRHPRARFYNLCLHPVNEIRESNAEAVAPRGSLLVWIDDMFSRPHTPLDRTLGRWQNIVEVAYVIPRHLRPRVTLKAFGVEPDDRNRPMNPQKHGHFSGQRYWRPEFWEAEASDVTLARTEALRRQASQIERRAERRHEARQQSRRQQSPRLGGGVR